MLCPGRRKLTELAAVADLETLLSRTLPALGPSDARDVMSAAASPAATPWGALGDRPSTADTGPPP